MYSFVNDYSEFCHPQILAAMQKNLTEQNPGYGMDAHSARARELIRAAVGLPAADVHLLVGGTPVNLISICAFLRPHQAVISADTGHINVHETGAIEATGHKIIAMPSPDGKLTPELIERAVALHPDEHMVKPKMVFVSNATEIGTIYTKAELTAVSECCKQLGLILYLDGARLATALTAQGNDLTLKDLATLTDAFYIGATKNGALIGEALVICNPALAEDFRYVQKQRGGLLAKGAIIGIQFEELFTGDLYFELARHANSCAQIIRDGLAKAGIRCLSQSPTNLIFPIFTDEMLAKLEEKYAFSIYERVSPTETCQRIVTSWATTTEAVQALAQDIIALSGK